MSKRFVLLAAAIIGLSGGYTISLAESEPEMEVVRVEQGKDGELEVRIDQMRQEIDKLHEKGRHEEAERLKRKVDKLADRPEPARRSPEKRIDAMRREAEHLHAKGRREQAERMERKANELAERLGARHRGEDRRGEGKEVERRIHHMEAAIENLHAAGLHEPAEDLERQLNDLRRERKERAERVRPGDDRGLDELRETVHHLRAEVKELRHVVNELRHRVDELSADR